MKTLLLLLSAAFLVGASGLPRMHERAIGALLLIPEDKMFFHLSSSLLRTPPDTEDSEISNEEAHETMEQQWNEQPAEQYPPAFHASSSALRSRRSTQPGAPAPGGGQGQQSGDRGHVDIGVSRGEGGSRRVDARGEGNVWQSNDGRGRVDVHGHYSRDYGGRYGTGRPQYGGGIRYSHRF